jgi:hypothetical protein
VNAAAAIDWEMSPEERTTLLYQAGYLDWKIRDYQLADHEAFCAWDAERQTQEHLDEAAAAGALYDNMWVDECGRRYGKTAQWLIRDVNAAIRRPGARGLIACAYQKNIGEIIVPLTKVLFRDAPAGYFPEYRGTHGADHECLIIPATESIIKLVGVDVHPKAIRGQWLDFCHLSEAAFIRNLRELVTSDIMPMFQDRPWAWMALESSTALTRDCEFNTEFREDAKKRGTYRKHTIRDNTHLTEEQIAKEERRSGGKGTANCQRELYCEEAREEKLMVVPEFDVARHVKPANQNAMPAHAHCYVSMDPGEQDPLGIIWGSMISNARSSSFSARSPSPTAARARLRRSSKRPRPSCGAPSTAACPRTCGATTPCGLSRCSPSPMPFARPVGSSGSRQQLP